MKYGIFNVLIHEMRNKVVNKVRKSHAKMQIGCKVFC
jgi:hypothetical protein